MYRSTRKLDLLLLLLLLLLFYLILFAPRFEISGSTRLDNVVGILGVGLDGEFGRASGAFEVEAEPLNAQISVANNVLFAGIELGALVDVVATSVAANAHWEHHPDLYLLILWPPCPR